MIFLIYYWKTNKRLDKYRKQVKKRYNKTINRYIKKS